MLSLENIGIEFAGRWLLQNASYQFNPGETTGLIGRNGAGKSSLLRVIAGQNLPSTGRVHRLKDSKLGYFHQDLLSYETERTIFEVAKDAFKEMLLIKDKLEEVLHEIENGNEDLALWDEVAHLQAEWDARDGDRLDAQVYEILAGLGFKSTDFHVPYKLFSGGWRMRVLLAKMLLEQPDILLLDEPTNHLDLPSIEWLENYLTNFQGICIIVSHDRYFLDRIVGVIVEISNQKLTPYPGNYSFYLTQKAERMELQMRAYENQQKFIADQQRFIDRFKAKASKAKQAQSKMKQLDKVERIEIEEEETVDMRIDFKVKVTSGREVLKLTDIQKSYGEKVILTNATATIERGDKIALIGANGLGKSTLLRIVAGNEGSGGERKIGHNVQEGFFAQHQLEALNLKNTILEEASLVGTNKTEMELRAILGCFMFSGEDATKYIQVLSGGEKSRVALAKVLLSEANFLLLDEPTNHLDIPSIQILVQALNAYQGTYIVISHDRHFLSQVANKIWYIEDQTLKEYPGTYEEFEYFKRRQAEALEQEKVAAATESKNAKNNAAQVKVKDEPQLTYEQQKQRKNRIRKLERELEETEAEMVKVEAEKQAVIHALAAPENGANFQKIAELQKQSATLDKRTTELAANWEKLIVELENM